MIRRNFLTAAALAACMTLGSASLALAHSPGYGGGNPYGWHQGWHYGGGMGPMMGGGQGMMMQGCPMAPGYGMGGHGMMGPGMMGPGTMGPGTMGPGTMGPGMMGPGMMGPGMMGPGYAPQGDAGPMMGPGGQRRGMGSGMGPGMGQGMGPGMGPGMDQGMMQPSPRNLTSDDVKVMLERRLAWQGNPHVKLGKVEEKDDDTILAEIVTQDGSLVQRLEVDRHSGWARMVR
ncbi:hypothetical protein AAFN88_08030 [Pelagibius sp. CAU 1746]|uniref:hypothetical protein n=1 Tax=Pelagibius sp. CAU 1746 TaxID=3140370 RepID=UPI00325BE07D